MGCGAHVVRLHRQRAGVFADSDAITLEQLQRKRGDGPAESLDHHLLALDAPLVSLPEITITADMGTYFCQGQPVMNCVSSDQIETV